MIKKLCITAIILGALFLIARPMVTFAQKETLYAFTGELCDFVLSHEGRMPNSWGELIEWSQARTDRHYLSVASWKSVLDLSWGTPVKRERNATDYITVNAANLKDQQAYINDFLRRRAGK